MTFEELIAKAIPGINEHDLDYVLWNRTPFPFDTNPKRLYKAAAGYRRACENGISLCELCTRPALPKKWTCASCDATLASDTTG